MESNFNEDSTYDSFLDQEDEELKLYQGIMNKKIGRRHITMDKEIRNKQKIINRLIKEKFGKNFIPIKLESLKAFESSLKTYLFSPQSQFLNNFPKLKRKLLKQRKIKEEKLKEKINIGSLLYLSMTRNDKSINDKFFQMSKNLSSSLSKNILSNALYKAKFEGKNKERINKILSYRNLRQSQLLNLNKLLEEDNLLNSLPKVSQSNRNYSNTNKISLKTNNINKYKSRNFNSNLQKYQTMTISSRKDNVDNSLKTFSPFSTFYKKSSSKLFTKHSKDLKKDLNKYVDGLDGQTKMCNEKLIKLIGGNWKVNLRKREERNREIVNLKKIIYDKKKLKPKKKINNINQIKSLINKAKIDFEGEATVEKIRKNELKNFGHYINVMSDDLVLSKVNDLFSKFELKLQGKNFSRDNLERLRKKRKQEKIAIKNRQKIQDNYIKMVQMENELSNIKDKFDETNLKVFQNAKKHNLENFLAKKK